MCVYLSVCVCLCVRVCVCVCGTDRNVMEDRTAEFELAVGGPRGRRHIPLSQVDQPYRIVVSGARRVKLPRKKQQAVRFRSDLALGCVGASLMLCVCV